MSDARQIIYDEIATKISGKKKLTGDSYMICCPYHDDSTPSAGINLSLNNNVPLGFMHCFGCGKKAHWNELAEHLGLQKLKQWEMKFRGKAESVSKRNGSSVVLYETVDQELQRALSTMELIPWPKNLPWRGYDGSVIKMLEGLFYNDSATEEGMLFFPVRVNGKWKGGVRAYLEKQKDGPSYLTTKGNWVKDYGIFGYEYTKNLVRKNRLNTLVIVEGPRDALRLIVNDIPAVATLGAENMSHKKIMRILAITSRIKTLYIMPDNDKGGVKLFKNTKACAKDLAEVKKLKLPRDLDKDGKVIKMDPDSAPESIIKKVKKIVYETE